jgi:hypothetical protein
LKFSPFFFEIVFLFPHCVFPLLPPALLPIFPSPLLLDLDKIVPFLGLCPLINALVVYTYLNHSQS